MIKLSYNSHAECLANNGDKFHIVSPANNVYATMVVSGNVAHQCITDEAPENALSPDSLLLNTSTAVASFEVL